MTNAQTQNTKNTLIGLAVVVALLCVACLCFMVFWNSLGSGGEKNYKTAAYIQCQLHVQDRLKAPSTAKFPASSTVNIQEMGGGVFQVRSYVDAQNSFGAMIRTNYFCKVQFTGTPQDDEWNSRYWNLLELNIFE